MNIKMLKTVLTGGLLVLVLAFVTGCLPAETGEQDGSTTSIIPMIVFLVLIFGLFYFVMVRPQRRKQKEHQMMVQELQKGDHVITAGGIYGTIESLNEENVVLKIESGIIRIARSSVVGRRER
jgi:preprotein translocase subunit YajC